MTETTAAVAASTDTDSTTEAFVERLFGAVLGAQLIQAAYLGDRLGFYRALAEGALTPPELAARTGTAERYAREWLEHQAVAGVLTVDDAAAAPDERRFRLPTGHAEVLTDVLSPNHVLPLARMVAGMGQHMDALVDAYRSGGGVSLGPVRHRRPRGAGRCQPAAVPRGTPPRVLPVGARHPGRAGAGRPDRRRRLRVRLVGHRPRARSSRRDRRRLRRGRTLDRRGPAQRARSRGGGPRAVPRAPTPPPRTVATTS